MPKKPTNIEEKLRASEEKYQAFIQNSHEGIWRFAVEEPISINLRTAEQIKQMYKYAYLAEANQAMANMYGLESAEDIVGARLGDLLIESDPQNKAYLTAFIKSGYKLSGAESHEVDQHGNDKYFINSLTGVIENGKLTHAWGTQQDVTEQRKAEKKLAESEQRFRTMADTAPVFIWLSDTKNMGTYFNKPWLDFTGRTLQEELGTGWVASVHPDDVERAASYCQACFDARKEFHMEFRLRRADGEYRWVADHGIPRYAPDGTFLGYIGSCLDIENLKRTLRRQHRLEATNVSLKKQRAQLIALNNAKDEFISIASHQLRTPASGVKQYLGMMLEGYGGQLNDEQLSMLMTAFDSNERQLKIITDLLRVAQVDAGKIQLATAKTDISQLMQQVIQEMHEALVGRRQTIVFDPPPKPILCTVDGRLLRMVLENLLDNASKYSRANSQITLKLASDKAAITIQVIDQGVGIRKEDQQKLFQKFGRLENPLSAFVSGTGLGLYWAKKIIDLHQGTIGLNSKPDHGTTFTITIPHQEQAILKAA